MIDNSMNPARAREMLAAPDLKWSPELIKSLAQGYLDKCQALDTINPQLEVLERELTELGNLHRAACDELEECRAVLRGLYP